MILNIVKDGDPILRRTSSPVTTITPELIKLANDMAETMYDSNGVGLSAVQVGHAINLIVVDVEWSHEGKNPIVMFNPKMVEYDGRYMYEEGCLSIPGIYCNVMRYKTIKVEYTDITGKLVTLDATEYMAKCIQHELDHLAGMLFVDKISQTEKVLIEGALKRISRGV